MALALVPDGWRERLLAARVWLVLLGNAALARLYVEPAAVCGLPPPARAAGLFGHGCVFCGFFLVCIPYVDTRLYRDYRVLGVLLGCEEALWVCTTPFVPFMFSSS